MPHTLSLRNIQFQHDIGKKSWFAEQVNLTPISYQLPFGRSFIFSSSIPSNIWSLSWIIGGMIRENTGIITIDNLIYDISMRKRNSWCVLYSINDMLRVPFYNPSIKERVRHSLRKNTQDVSEEDIINAFELNVHRYDRPLSMLSHEAWQASCAIGFANGRTIFCFPYIDPYIIDKSKKFLRLIRTLTSLNLLVIIPTQITSYTKLLCDEVINIDALLK